MMKDEVATQVLETLAIITQDGCLFKMSSTRVDIPIIPISK